MYENVGRKIVLILALLGISLLLLFLPKRPIRLGLDLAGGERLVYGLDFEEAKAAGSVSGNQSQGQVLEDTIAIIRARVDPNGVREPVIRSIGTNRIEIQLPSTAEVSGAEATAKLASAVPGTGDEVALRGGIQLRRRATRPRGLPRRRRRRSRSTRRTSATPCAPAISCKASRAATTARKSPPTPRGRTVVLVSDDQIQNAIENLGDLRFYIAATDADFQKAGTDRNTEHTKATDWLKANPQVAMKVFNALPREAGGPPPGLAWFPRRLEEGEPFAGRESRVQALAVQPAEWTFTGESLERVYKSSDHTGFPAVGFEMRARYVKPFTDFTTTHVNELMAIVLNEEIATMATINEPLPGSGPDLGPLHRPQGRRDGQRAALGLAQDQAQARIARVHRRDGRPGVRRPGLDHGPDDARRDHPLHVARTSARSARSPPSA
jgi:hypothetical protein